MTLATTRAVIALGSNLGDRGAILVEAVEAIAQVEGVEVVAVSSIIETPALRPWGVDRVAPPYLNGIALIDTTRDAVSLLAELAAIEQHHGRIRDERWGDRTLDLDIITFGDERSQSEHLTLPHPRAHERDFVVRPWLEVDPEAVLPGHGRVADLVAARDAEHLNAEPDSS